MRHPLVLLLAGSAALSAMGCSEDPSLFLGGPPGAPAGQRLSSSALTIVVGDSVQLGARVQDEVGNTVPGVAPAVTSCDGSVASVGTSVADPVYTTSVWVRADNLGVTCLVVSGAGFTDTVGITTGPAGLRIVGTNPLATTDTVGSGNQFAFGVIAVGRNGDTLSGTTTYSWTSSATNRVAIHRVTGEAAGKSTGAATLQVRAPGGAMDQKNALVVAGVFGGSLSQVSGEPGDLLTVRRAADGAIFDADAAGTLGGVPVWVERRQPDTLYIAMPATGTAGAQTLTLTNMGSLQIAQNVSYTSNTATADRLAGVTRGVCQAPGTAPELSDVLSPFNTVHVAFGGLSGAAARSCGEGSGGTQPDIFFRITAGASDVNVNFLLTWGNGSDLDLFVCDDQPIDGDGGWPTCDFGSLSGSATQEALNNVTVAAGTTRYLVIMTWTTGSTQTNARLTVTGL